MEKNFKDNIVELQMKDTEFAVTEAFNTLRTNIMFSGEDIKTIMFTSTHPAEGKSFVAMQLAKSFAEINKKVVYLDCDLRKSVTLSRYKIRGKKSGLTEYLTGQNSQLIYETNIPNLAIILSGHLVPKPIEMLQSKKFNDMLSVLRDQFDYVIVDAPPIGNVVDACIIAPKVDGTVFVVRSDAVGRNHAMQAKKQLEKSNGRLLGVAFNGVGIHKGSYYYKYSNAYGDYYYGEKG
ncbi:MAG: CpsD/CapB family tyrosine-protein kinase [Lachnospira sp.]